LDVGHGDSIFVRFPNGRTMLIDGGVKFSRYDIGRRVLLPFLWFKKVSHIDYLVVTHSDLDHIGGLFSIIDRLSIGEIWMSSTQEKSEFKKQFFRFSSQEVYSSEIQN